MNYFIVHGSNYHCGLQIGRKLRSQIKLRLKLMDITSSKVKKNILQLQKIHQLCLQKYPQYIKELQGYSAGSGINYWQILMLNIPRFGSDHGCTTLAFNDTKQTILAHNEDGSDFEKSSYCALIKYVQKNGKIKNIFHAFVYAGELAGNAYAWNSSGLFFTVNNIPTKTILGIPQFFIARSLCEAQNIPQALTLLRKNPSDNSFNYTIAQGKKIISVEHYGPELAVKETKGKFYHTNHFLSKKLSPYGNPSQDSRQRLQRLQELKNETDPHKILLDRHNLEHPLYCRGEAEKRTLSQVIFNIKKKKISIYTP